MPQRDSALILTDAPPTDADARVAYEDGPLQFGDVRAPARAGPHPLVVVVHGGYWQAIYNLTHTGHLCVDLAQHGIATWNIEYRRLGDPGGGWPGTFDDVVAALAYVPELASRFSLDLERVVLMGHSVGGHLALWASARSRFAVRAVVSLAGVVDLRETDRRGDDHGLIARLLGGSAAEEPERWSDSSPRALLPLGIRQVLVCGTADPHHAPNAAYAEAARETGDDVTFISLEGAGHFELVDPQTREWALVRATIEELIVIPKRQNL